MFRSISRRALLWPCVAVLCLCVLAGGRLLAQDRTPTDRPELLGGQTTIFNDTPNAFGQPVPGLERGQELFFFVGNSFFNQNWVTAPASTTARDGLGPLFNATSCAGCHFKDGRGRAPEFDGEAPTGLILRISVPERNLYGENLPDPLYGGQFHDAAIPSVESEVDIVLTYTEIAGIFNDGTPYTLLEPHYSISNFRYGDPHPELMVSPRVATQMIGLGLLEAIPEATLISLADPNDADGNGISGRPNYVWDRLNQQMAVGRIGWKAQNSTVFDQVAEAFNGDLGITSGLITTTNCTATQATCITAMNGGEPEISDDDLLKVVLYASVLAVPAQRNWDDPQVQAGRTLFEQAQCSACHTPQLETGIHPVFPSLSNQTIRPYTDLLLHDMGDGLADGRPDFQATGSEWRTPPLWGIGLFEVVNGHTRYLHDGRARDLTEAILWHGGEAEEAQRHFVGMSVDEREALIAFLKSL
jgi:CxxC motif-containing protein (DUF1111 family)